MEEENKDTESLKESFEILDFDNNNNNNNISLNINEDEPQNDEINNTHYEIKKENEQEPNKINNVQNNEESSSTIEEQKKDDEEFLENVNAITKENMEKNKLVNTNISSSVDNTNNASVSLENTEKKRNVMPIVIMILVFVLFMSAVIALPYISDFFNKDNKKKSLKQAQVTKNIAKMENNDNIKSNVDINKILTNIKHLKSYALENVIDIFVKNNQNKEISIKLDNIYSFNETKYKIETNNLIENVSQSTTYYYEKLDEQYNIYSQDDSTQKYIKSGTTIDQFNSIYNIFPNMIDYLIKDNRIVAEKQIIVDDNNHINITIKTDANMLENLSFETDKIQNKIDISKLDIDGIEIELYLDENKDLYKIEFSIEDKNIYQKDIDGDIESIISKYTFDNFNKVKDISLPSI